MRQPLAHKLSLLRLSQKTVIDMPAVDRSAGERRTFLKKLDYFFEINGYRHFKLP
jgi:hypothetical protein